MKSSIYTVLCMTIRLGALWLGINVLLTFPGAYVAVTNGDLGHHSLMPLLFWSVSIVVVAFLLWLYPGLLARPAAARSSRQVFDSPVSAEQMQHAALVVLGMWFVMTGFIDLASKILPVLFFRQMGIVGDAGTSLTIKILLKPVVQIIVGCVLTLGSRGLTGVLHRVRGGPIYSPSLEADIDSEADESMGSSNAVSGPSGE